VPRSLEEFVTHLGVATGCPTVTKLQAYGNDSCIFDPFGSVKTRSAEFDALAAV